MATPKAFSSSTWRVLGLSVAAGYTGLGLIGVFMPQLAALLLGLIPQTSLSQEAESLLTKSITLLGVRDLSIGIALLVFNFYKMPQAMGILILSGMVLCYADSFWIWQSRGRAWGCLFGIGATFWGWIGLNLFRTLLSILVIVEQTKTGK